MPGMQEFLASFAVDIDESGVNHLQNILKENRTLADGLAAAYRNATSALRSYIAESSTSGTPSIGTGSSGNGSPSGGASGGSTRSGYASEISADLDLSQTQKTLTAFFRSSATRVPLSADTSGLLRSASSALDTIRSLFSGADITIPVTYTPKSTSPLGGDLM